MKTKQLNELSDKEVQDLINLQGYLDRLADVEYQSYWLKIDLNEFWLKYLWIKLGMVEDG